MSGVYKSIKSSRAAPMSTATILIPRLGPATGDEVTGVDFISPLTAVKIEIIGGRVAGEVWRSDVSTSRLPRVVNEPFADGSAGIHPTFSFSYANILSGDSEPVIEGEGGEEMLMRRFGQVIVEVHKAALESEGPPLVFDAKTALPP
jgi:hypothetical protein